MTERIVLIGGSNIDYIAKSSKKLIERDSNIGKLSISFGGVGRNIVENLARIGNRVSFFTSIGNDELGQTMKKHLLKLGVRVYSPEFEGTSSSYLSIHDSDGKMKCAVCDERANDKLNIDFISRNDSDITKAEYVCLDTNVLSKTISDLFQRYPNKKWIVEAVSKNKVGRIRQYLNQIYLFKGNQYEAQAVIDSDTIDVSTNIKRIIKLGTKNVIVSNGKHAVYYGNKDGVFKIDITPLSQIVNDTGAGDAMFAGIVDQINAGQSIKNAIIFGNQLARETLKTSNAVSSEIDKYKYNHE